MKILRPESVPAISLYDAIAGLDVSGETRLVTVTRVCLGSRIVHPDDLYVILPGFHTHEAGFTTQAMGRGAVAILTDPEGARVVEGAGMPVLISHRLRPVMTETSARVYGEPTSGLELFEVAGVNGKTTTVALLEATLAAIERCVGATGALGFRLDGRTLPSDRSTITTPDSPDLQALLTLMRERGTHVVATEVFSHAMAMSRADALKFEVTTFLNLGRDHLGFRRNTEEYFEVKAALFIPGRTRTVVVWIGDGRGCWIADRARRTGLSVVTVSTCEEASYRLTGCEPVLPLRKRVQPRTASGEMTTGLALPGWHNMVDAAIVVAMFECAGIPTGITLPGLARAQAPRRMQVLPLPEKALTMIVDFAHTPQAVAAIPDTIQGFGEVVTIVGCGGDRGPDKRPLVGRAATKRGNILIVTDDNPRTEDPARIRAAIFVGIGKSRTRVVEAGGGSNAIGLVLAMAECNSVVTIFGKGHEQDQQTGDRVMAFDDALVTLEVQRRTEGDGRWG